MRSSVPETSGEYRSLAEHFLRSGAALSRHRLSTEKRVVRKSLEILRLDRLLLPALMVKYRARLREIMLLRGACCDTVPDCSALRSKDTMGLNEVFLYHGCRATSIDEILENGFDASRGGERNGRLFGRGTYFTDVAAKADGYTDAQEDGWHCLIVAQVCLGRVHSAVRPMPSLEQPPISGLEGTPSFDSVVGEDADHGGSLDHREYIVFSGGQALPRYLLWYKHSECCACFQCCGAAQRRGLLLAPVLPGVADKTQLTLTSADRGQWTEDAAPTSRCCSSDSRLPSDGDTSDVAMHFRPVDYAHPEQVVTSTAHSNLLLARRPQVRGQPAASDIGLRNQCCHKQSKSVPNRPTAHALPHKNLGHTPRRGPITAWTSSTSGNTATTALNLRTPRSWRPPGTHRRSNGLPT